MLKAVKNYHYNKRKKKKTLQHQVILHLEEYVFEASFTVDLTFVKTTAYSEIAYSGTFPPIRIDIAVSMAVETPSSCQ